MQNNTVFRTVLHLTGASLDLVNLIYIFKLGGMAVTKSQIKGWRTALDNARSSHMSDHALDCFFEGLFAYRDEMRDKGVNVFDFPRKIVVK